LLHRRILLCFTFTLESVYKDIAGRTYAASLCVRLKSIHETVDSGANRLCCMLDGQPCFACMVYMPQHKKMPASYKQELAVLANEEAGGRQKWLTGDLLAPLQKVCATPAAEDNPCFATPPQTSCALRAKCDCDCTWNSSVSWSFAPTDHLLASTH
jgi:hypothetical protein